MNYRDYYTILGPTFHKKMDHHQIVNIGMDLIAVGGVSNRQYSGYLHKFSCENQNCKWEKLPKELKIPRSEFVAIPVPNDFVNC